MPETIAIDVFRGGHLESTHRVHAAIWRDGTGLVEAWGDPDRRIFPRSSSKMIQALPLVESGAAARAGLGSEHLALACASHQGAEIHTGRVAAWLDRLGLSESDLRCGAQIPNDSAAAAALLRGDTAPDQRHNNCSGKHTGFLTLAQRIGGGPDYVDPDHPVQRAVLDAWSDVTDAAPEGFGIDGCAAPNHRSPLGALARAMASFAAAAGGSQSGLRAEAQRTLVAAMMAHPDLVAGEGRACTALMRAMAGSAAVKTGAEGVFVAILPAQGLGIALKAECGTTRAAEAAIVALLARHGALDPAHPVARAYDGAAIQNRRGQDVGRIIARLP